MRQGRNRGARRTTTIVALTAMVAATLFVMVAPAAQAVTIFSDDFDSGNMSNWNQVTRITIDGANGSPGTPSARGQVSSQSAYAYRNLGSTHTDVCVSTNVNVSAGSTFDLFRLRTASGGPIVKAFLSSGSLRLRSDFAGTQTNSGVQLGSGWHNVELCGTVGSNTTWDLYRDGVVILNDWQANTGSTGVGRVQIGDTASKTFTANWDHVVVDEVPGDEGGDPGDTTPPSTPGQPSGTSPSVGTIQISWAASSDPSTPITYRIYRDGGATPIDSTTATSFTDIGLAPGSSYTYAVDAVDGAGNESGMSPASAPITVLSAPPPDPGEAIFSDDFDGGNMSNWTQATRITVDNANGSPAPPSARGQVSGQSAYAFRNLGSTHQQVCFSANVNVSTGTTLDLLRLRTATGGAIVKVLLANGTLRVRSDFASTATNSGVQLGTGWHNLELCGTVGSNTAWDLYRDGTLIVDGWQANTGSTPVGRVQIGDTASRTLTANWDHVRLDTAPGEEGGTPGDTTPPTTPGQPTGVSPAIGSILISWPGSTDESLPLTYRVYRDGGSTSIGSTTNTSFTDNGLTPGSTHTYRVDAVDTAGNESDLSPASTPIGVMAASTGQPRPLHTQLPPDIPRNNVPRITAGDITDLEVIGNRVFIAGNFTTIQNNTGTNNTSYNQPYLAAYNLTTGLVDTAFRPTFSGGAVIEIEATPDGTKLFIVGRFNTVNGVTKRKVAALNPTNGALITQFTANANSQAISVEATNSTVFVGGDFTTINGAPRSSLAAVSSATGQVVSSFVNNLSGGIGVDGRLTVQALRLSHDETKLLVVHTGRQVNGQDRYGVALIDATNHQLLPWRSQLWDANLQFVGGIQRIFAGDISPDDSYFVVTSGSGGDRPPISDTAIAFPLNATGDDVEPLWISRAFDSIYSVAISEVAVYLGGHMNYMESPTAPDPWPGLTDQGYGRGQGLAGYGLGDDIVTREHIGAVDPLTGKAVEWNPGSNSYEGNQAMLATPRGIITGGDAGTQGGLNVGRVAFYDFNTLPAPGPNESTIINPIEGRVEEADVEFVIDGTATATSGVNRVELTVYDRDSQQYLQDNLTTWGGSNTINANLATPGATSTAWSLPLTISGNRRIRLYSRTVGNNGSRESTNTQKKFETFGLADQTPTTGISGPGGSVIPTLTFEVTGTASDDFGVNSITLAFQDEANRYLQDDGDVDAAYNTFRVIPDVVGATAATWRYEVTLPYEDTWTARAVAVDNAGQSDLRSADRTWIVNENAIEPSVAITTPEVMTPPTSNPPMTLPPGDPLTFSGSATDDEGLNFVEISLRNTVTRENLASDGSWGDDVNAGWYRVSPSGNMSGTSYNWSYTTPFDLRPGTYSFAVRAVDDIGLTTSSNFQGRLTINVQVPGDVPPNGTITPTGTQPNLTSLHLDLAGAATDDFGVAAVRLTIRDRDTARYVQPNGTMGAAFSLLDATLASPGATSTTWTLSLDLPTTGDYDVTVFAFDTSDQQDLSTSGATARYPAYVGDLPPTFVDNLFNPIEGQVFTEARIVASGRLEDDQQIAEAHVAIRNEALLYMSSSGTFTSSSISWRNAFLNSPGSPGSNYAYTSPPLPAGNYTVFVRGEDQHGFTTNPPYERNVVVEVPPGNTPPVANFTYSCAENVCDFDGRSSTDENAATLTYSWNFGNGSGSGPIPTRTYTSANTYTVTLTVRDEWGVFSDPVSQMITIVEPAGNLPPTAVINPPSCSGLVCNFSSVGSADPNTGDSFSRLWNFGDGTATSTSTSPSHTFPADGTYTVTLTVTDGWGDFALVTLDVTVAAPPAP